MFVRNFYKILGGVMLSGSTATNDKAALKKPNGSNVYFPTTGMSTSQISYWLLLTGGSMGRKIGNTVQNNIGWGESGLYFGSGTTKPTIDDYRLESETIQNLAGIPNVTVVHNDESFMSATVSMVVTNNNSEAVTISEVGLFGSDSYMHMSLTSTSTSGAAFLLERSLLDKPVTIQPGGVGKIEYTIRLNFPEA